MTLSPALTAAVQALAVAGDAVREAIRTYELWSRDKSARKTAAIARIMREPNALSHKPHSISTAESVVEQDQAYRDFLAAGLGLQLAKHKAEEAYLAAQFICLYHATHGGRVTLDLGMEEERS